MLKIVYGKDNVQWQDLKANQACGMILLREAKWALTVNPRRLEFCNSVFQNDRVWAAIQDAVKATILT